MFPNVSQCFAWPVLVTVSPHSCCFTSSILQIIEFFRKKTAFFAGKKIRGQDSMFIKFTNSSFSPDSHAPSTTMDVSVPEGRRLAAQVVGRGYIYGPSWAGHRI